MFGQPHALPDFPWDRLAPFGEIAKSHPGGAIDLSIGTPVDSVPQVIQSALISAADSPGYPTTVGTPAFRRSAAAWFERNLGVKCVDENNVIPSIGSKEIVAWLPFLVGLSARDVVAIPAVAYPTYDVGARLAGCHVVTADGVAELEAARVRAEASGRRLTLVWLNSPSNPTGRVASADELRTIVTWAREHEILVASDECYIELGWDVEPVSVLHPDVVGDSAHGVLAVHSLSKRSNFAGYRAGVVAGDSSIIARLLEVRKHAGMMVSAPVQAAAAAAFDDDIHVAVQKALYAQRRVIIKGALEAAGFEISHSNAGLYLWATRHENCWDSVRWFAERGVIVAPGEFYGAASADYVRVAMTATDERIGALPGRLIEV